MPQLKAYHRPSNVEDALKLLARPNVNTAVLGGGTFIIAHLPEMVTEVVDLQTVAGLDKIDHTGVEMTIGAMVRLQTIVDDAQAPALLREAARREGPNTLRHASTIGGVIAGPDKESELLAALLVFEADVKIQTGSEQKNVSLELFMRDIQTALAGGIIVAVEIQTAGKTASDRVARTPADKPIVAAVARKDPGGNLRLALCGVDSVPVLVAPDNVKAAVKPPEDFRGSREYRRQMAATLAKRVINQLEM